MKTKPLAAQALRMLLACLLTAVLSLAAHADTFGSGANQFDIDFTTVGDADNATDDTGYGAVAYTYRIGTYEVSRDMITKYNALGGGPAITIPDMTTAGGNGVNRPATGVDWNEAARFVNWLNTSSGHSAAYKFTTGGASDNIALWTVGDAGYNPANPFRNNNAYYFLPNEDEWYKAAYYDPNANTGSGGYWNYTTGSDSVPTAVTSGTTSGTAVCGQAEYTGPADVTSAGGRSPYGTMAQGGNVWEWCESGVTPPNNSADERRVIRGGNWILNSINYLAAPFRFNDHPTLEAYSVGFRVASARALGSNANLSGLTLSSGTLNPVFAPNVAIYSATVANGVTSVSASPVTEDSTATFQITGGSELVVGSNTITVTVTAEDGTTIKVYTVTITRLPLSALFASAATIPVTSDGYVATGNTVEISLGFAPPTGTALTVVKNTGLDFIQGKFSNLAQGQTVVLPYNGARYRFVADYYGGSGNDLVLHWANQGGYHWGGGLLNPRSLDTSGVLAGKTVVQMEGGSAFFLALCADGTIVGLGANTNGQLGDGTTTARFTPVAVSMTGALTGKTVVSVAAGDNHSLAVCSDGTVAAWGANNFGQLGNGTISTQSLVPVQVQFAGVMAGKKVVAVDAGSIYSLALFSDGTVAAWGSNSYGQLGDGTKIDKNQPVEVLRSGALSGKTVVAVSTMYLYCLALCSDGTAVSWGSGFIGQLANNDTKDSTEPVAVQITGETVAGIAAGSWHSVFLCSDGAILTCGHNKLGELGDGTDTISTKIPVQVLSSGILSDKQVVAVASEWHSILALCSDGKIASWGMNSSGQLGNGQTTDSNVPVWVDETGALAGKTVVSVAGGNAQGLAIAASPLSSNSLLSDLTVSSGTLSPAFSSGMKSYTINVAWNVGTLTITPTASDTYATITANGHAVAAGAASEPITLSHGVNDVAVVVTAEDGSSTTYSIQVTREVNYPPAFSGFTGSTAWQTAASLSCAKILAKASDVDGDAMSVTSAGPSSSGGGTAMLQGATILYTPASAFSGTDTFPITITDARGATVEGMVTMNVGAPPDGGGQGGNPPRLTILPAGKIGIAFQGIPGRSYLIQRSTNLADWTPIATIPAAENGAVEFIDENPPEGSGFYRLRKP